MSKKSVVVLIYHRHELLNLKPLCTSIISWIAVQYTNHCDADRYEIATLQWNKVLNGSPPCTMSLN
jgi:hypothetical protein